MGDLDYELLDLDDGRKLERFGAATIVRPAPAARGPRARPDSEWSGAAAEFVANGRGGDWALRRSLPDPWIVRSAGIEHLLGPAAGGQVGLFPEQAELRLRLRDLLDVKTGPPRVLDLFGYTGGSALAAAAAGAAVTHVDSSRAALRRARENAARNGLGEDALRSVPEHVPRFVEREEKRGSRYDAVVLDPPSFGRGPSGEMWKIERDLDALLAGVARILASKPVFVALTAHTESWRPPELAGRLDRSLAGRSGRTEAGSLLLAGGGGVTLSSGAFALRVF